MRKATKSFYKHIRSAIISKVSTQMILLNPTGHIVTDIVASLLVSYFSSVYVSETPGPLAAVKTPGNPFSLEEIVSSPHLVELLFDRIDVSMLPGPDELTDAILKRCAGAVSVPVSLV